MFKRRGFTLVELLIVVGIIAILISILMPALSAAQRQSKTVACASNMRQIGTLLLMYANENRGQMIPLGPKGRHLGGGVHPNERWPVHVFKPPVPNPRTLICPADDQLNPGDYADAQNWNVDPWLVKHSYLLNVYVLEGDIKFGRTKGMDPTRIIVAGEKNALSSDYHMDLGQWQNIVELHRHGMSVGSNYLHMDGSVRSRPPMEAKMGIEPWNPMPDTQPSAPRPTPD
jgi:prepilin-type N-terminal cleavage/methylation domain-containing protein